MTTILDRYILKQFLKTFVIFFISLTGLFIVFDALTNIEEFLNASDSMAGFFHVLLAHYSLRAIVIFDQTSGFLILISAMFTVAWLQRFNEMGAISAAGVSTLRIMKPMIIASLLIAMLAAANREFVMPPIRDKLVQQPRDLGGKTGREMEQVPDWQTGIFLGGEKTFADKQRIEKPLFRVPRDGKNVILKGENAYYMKSQGDRPGGYLFEKAEIQGNNASDSESLNDMASLWIRKRRVLITPHDEPKWLAKDQCFVVSNISFAELTGGRAMRQYSSTMQMIDALRNPSLDLGAQGVVRVHSRILQPAMDMTLLFLGLPLAVSRGRRNIFASIGMCILISTLFLLVTMSCENLGRDQVLAPALAAWLPLLIFVPVAGYLFENLKW